MNISTVFFVKTKKLFCTVDWRKQKGLRTPKKIAPHLFERFRKQFGPCFEHLLVAVEKYEEQDGKKDIHIHVLLWCSTDVKFLGTQLDSVFGTHGHYKAADDNDELIRYICKDGKWYVHSAVPFSGMRVMIRNILKKVDGTAAVADQYTRMRQEVTNIQVADTNAAVNNFLMDNHHATDLCLQRHETRAATPANLGNRSRRVVNHVEKWPANWQ